MGQAQPIQGSWKDLDRFGKIPKLWRAWCFFCACRGEMFMVQQQDPAASAACRHTAITECMADSMAAKGWAAKGWACEQNSVKSNIFFKHRLGASHFPSCRDVESLLLLGTSFASPTQSTGFTGGKQVWQGSGHETLACPR